ncbi:hypothetical protein AXF42_Ash017164 [Apostasia shenzhenica]|uniref:DUF4408 domain-containing protein n=1 Tax=Apostasia shenzhenica TaxID=1088818 RepID=A0A2H9ZV84_9ASPA|nr:hypothetical protein AXF42_Ash017164 [Apostasia shenzhenica]
MDALKAEKEIAIRRFRRIRQIGRLLRCIEAAAALLLLSYSSAYVPAAARNLSYFVRRAAAVLISPQFVFLVGNGIVLVLFTKSGHFSSPASAAGYVCGEVPRPAPPHLGPAEEVACEDKAVCGEIRVCRRSWSEMFERPREETKFRRARTEIGRKGGKQGSPTAHDSGGLATQVRVDPEEEDDADEFRRTIEEFIAKQQRFQREESLAIVARGSDGATVELGAG